jgi:hypothetical protein
MLFSLDENRFPWVFSVFDFRCHAACAFIQIHKKSEKFKKKKLGLVAVPTEWWQIRKKLKDHEKGFIVSYRFTLLFFLFKLFYQIFSFTGYFSEQENKKKTFFSQRRRVVGRSLIVLFLFLPLLNRCPKWCNFPNVDIDPERHDTPNAATDIRRHQWASGVSVLPAHLLVLLFAEATLPGQARAVRHAIRLRVLPPAVSHEELAHHPQESAASRLKWHAEASPENVRDQERARSTCAAAPAAPPVWLRRRAGSAAPGHPTIKETQSIIAITNALSDEFVELSAGQVKATSSPHVMDEKQKVGIERAQTRETNSIFSQF